MPERLKSHVDYREELWNSALSRISDEKYPWRTSEEQRSAANMFMQAVGEGLETPFLQGGDAITSITEQFYLKDFKYFTRLHNSKTNKLGDFVKKNARDNFASVLEAQRELIGLNSEVTEEEIKLLHNYSKVHFNAFVRGIDKPMRWGDQTALQDFKTGFAFNRRYLMSILNDAGLTLPIRTTQEVPILDVYIVDELSDVGDTVHPIETSDPKNLIRKNKVFRHVVVRAEHDHTTRKYKSKTSSDTYPYSCESVLTLELEFPSMVQVNYLRIEPIGDSTVGITENGLTYKAEDGSDVSLSAIEVPTETATTLLFQPIHTKFLRVSLRQTGTVGRRQITLGDKRLTALNDLLSSTDMQIRFPNTKEEVTGRVYDFSLANLSSGLITFEPKGIFRSGHALEIDSPLGMDLRYTAEQIIPFDDFETYYSTLIVPEGEVLFEGYLYTKLYGGTEDYEVIAPVAYGAKKHKNKDILKDTLVVDSIVPVPDSYPMQLEYLDPVVNDAKCKLFPDVVWNADEKIMQSMCISNYIFGYLPFTVTTSSEADENNLVIDFGYYEYSRSEADANTLYETFQTNLEDSDEDGMSLQRGVPFTLTDIAYDATDEGHIAVRNTLDKAIRSIVAVKRGGDVDKPIEVNYQPPAEADLREILGRAWIEASDEEKASLNDNPEDYLLIDKGLLWGGSKELLYNRNPAYLYARTGTLPSNRTTNYNFLGDSLYNTKLLQLTIENVDTSGSTDTITVSMELVREVKEINDSTLKYFSSKDKHLIHNLTKIYYAATKYQVYSTKVLANLGSLAGTPIEAAFLELAAAVLGGQPVISKVTSFSPRSEQAWSLILGSRGSSVFGPVKAANEVGIGSGNTTYPIGSEVALSTLGLDEWYLAAETSPADPMADSAVNTALWKYNTNYIASDLIDIKQNIQSLAIQNILHTYGVATRTITTSTAHGLHVGDLVAAQTTTNTNSEYVGTFDGQFKVVGIKGAYTFHIKEYDDSNMPVFRGLPPAICLLLNEDEQSDLEDAAGYSVASFEATASTAGFSNEADYWTNWSVHPWAWNSLIGLNGELVTNNGNAIGDLLNTDFTSGSLKETLYLGYTADFAWPLLSYWFDIEDENPNPIWSGDGTAERCCRTTGYNQGLGSFFTQIHNSGFQPSPVEVYENDALLVIGIDYEISVNSGADWLRFWPVDSGFAGFWREAQAGKFFIRFKNPQPSSIYWIKYRTYRNQQLSSEGKIYLHNGRVTCDSSLQNASGTINTVIIARTRSANPYLTPLLTSYNLRVQEKSLVKRHSGKFVPKKLEKTSRRSTLNVS